MGIGEYSKAVNFFARAELSTVKRLAQIAAKRLQRMKASRSRYKQVENFSRLLSSWNRSATPGLNNSETTIPIH